MLIPSVELCCEWILDYVECVRGRSFGKEVAVNGFESKTVHLSS